MVPHFGYLLTHSEILYFCFMLRVFFAGWGVCICPIRVSNDHFLLSGIATGLFVELAVVLVWSYLYYRHCVRQKVVEVSLSYILNYTLFLQGFILRSLKLLRPFFKAFKINSLGFHSLNGHKCFQVFSFLWWVGSVSRSIRT